MNIGEKVTMIVLFPFSGGKDSTYVLYKVVKEHKLKPLVISFDHGFYRGVHLKNVEKTLKFLGVDYHLFKPNMKVVGRTMLESLKKEKVISVGIVIVEYSLIQCQWQ